MKAFEGLGVALVTPFNQQLDVDFKALTAILEHLYASNSVDYFVVLGSTGEAATLSSEEKQEIMTFVRDFNKNRLPLVFGHSGNDTRALIQSLYSIDFSGYSAVLCASPAYVKPSQAGIIAHYHTLSDNSPLPLILYNVPSRTGSNIASETVKILAENKNIIGIKEASGDLVQAMEVRANTPEEFLLISGDDTLTIPMCSIGAVGLISVMANAYPAVFKNILTSCKAGEFNNAASEALKTLKINHLMNTEGNPIGIKQLLAHLGLCSPNVRLPLAKASSELSEKIKNQLL
jgi:4-hydroxy-tetrahydrodipicolinate synthase